MPFEKNPVAKRRAVEQDRSDDKEWVKSEVGRAALAAAREQALAAIRKLENPNNAVVELIKKKFA